MSTRGVCAGLLYPVVLGAPLPVMTDPSPEHPPVPLPYRLPRVLAHRIRATARRSRRRRPTTTVPVICIFGAGAYLGDDQPWPDRPPG